MNGPGRRRGLPGGRGGDGLPPCPGTPGLGILRRFAAARGRLGGPERKLVILAANIPGRTWPQACAWLIQPGTEGRQRSDKVTLCAPKSANASRADRRESPALARSNLQARELGCCAWPLACRMWGEVIRGPADLISVALPFRAWKWRLSSRVGFWY